MSLYEYLKSLGALENTIPNNSGDCYSGKYEDIDYEGSGENNNNNIEEEDSLMSDILLYYVVEELHPEYNRFIENSDDIF